MTAVDVHHNNLLITFYYIYCGGGGGGGLPIHDIVHVYVYVRAE